MHLWLVIGQVNAIKGKMIYRKQSSHFGKNAVVAFLAGELFPGEEWHLRRN